MQPFKSLLISLFLALSLWGCRNSPPTPQPTPVAGEGAIVVDTPAAATAPAAAVPEPTFTPAPGLPTPTPTATTAVQVQLPVTCDDVEANWGQNWEAVVSALEQLIAANQSCGEEPLPAKKYAAHYIYGVALEEQGENEAAIKQYQAALFLDPVRLEALRALFRLKALPKPTPPACLSTAAPRPDPAPAEAVDPSLFVSAEGDQLRLQGRPFRIKGVNYYPRHAPWNRFFNEADPTKMAQEFDLIEQAGFNTVRVFLWNTPLFTCQPEDAIPNETAFALVDSLFQMAEERKLKLILTLNDLPDLMFRPLYTDFAHYDNQTIYIIRRYRNEPALLAWDVRNGADDDYIDSDDPFTKEEVLAWLDHTTQLIREHDPHHLITAGWSEAPLDTEPYVDIVAFHHWEKPSELQARLDEYQEAIDKPLLLASTGYHSWPESPDNPQSEITQAENLGDVITMVEAEGLAGWLIWSAFDFVPAPGQGVTNENFFGLWRDDLTAKPILKELPLP
jgi:hypothetical protein